MRLASFSLRHGWFTEGFETLDLKEAKVLLGELARADHHSGNAHPVANGLKNDREEALDTKLYLTIAAIVAILYALAFLLIPVQASLFFSSFAEPRAVLYLRFVGAAVLAWGLIVWFARDFRDWDAVRGVLIGSVVGLAVNIILNVAATIGGWLNAKAWGSTVVLMLLLLGGIYQLLEGGQKRT